MSTQHPNDDRQHGHAIRRRQGGRTSIYHEQLYPVAAMHKNRVETFETYDSGDLARAVAEGEPGAAQEHARRARHEADWAAAGGDAMRYTTPSAIRASDTSTGAY